MLKRFSIVISLAISITAVSAQDRHIWTLKDCFSYAEEHSYDLQKQDLSIERNDAAIKEGKWAFVPSFSLSSNYTMSTGRVLDPTTYQFVETSYTGNSSSSVSGDITLFEGGKKSFALQKAKLALKQANAQKASAQFNLKENVISAFMDVLCS